MEAESNSLLYIIISIILLIISTVGKNKNKQKTIPQQTANEPQPTQAPWQKELEDVFGELTGMKPANDKKYPKHEQWEYEPEPIKTQAFEPILVSNELQKDFINPIESIPTGNVNTINITKNEYVSDRYLFMDENEMRKAVIYSEILNRKYF